MLQNFSYLVVVLLIYVQISCVVPASQNHTLQLVHVVSFTSLNRFNDILEYQILSFFNTTKYRMFFF